MSDNKKEHQMEFYISGTVSAAMLAYLIYAMFNPEKF
jgi:K+-transporting ATPase KdpF subunit